MTITPKAKVLVLLPHSYPGGPLLNPLGLAKDIKNAQDLKLKEIKNGLAFAHCFLYIVFSFSWVISYFFYGFCISFQDVLQW